MVKHVIERDETALCNKRSLKTALIKLNSIFVQFQKINSFLQCFANEVALRSNLLFF